MNAQSRRLTPGRNVLSFDAGNKNFAFAFVEQTSAPGETPLKFKLHAWCLLDLQGTTVEVLTNNVVRALDLRPWMLMADNVVVEGQLGQNTEMKVLAHVIQTYFYTRCNVFHNFLEAVEQGRHPSSNLYVFGPAFSFVTASSKFKYLDSALLVPPEPNENQRSYAKRKSVVLAEDILATAFGPDSAEVAFLQSHRSKQDDLADCLLQALFQLKLLGLRDKQRVRFRALPAGGTDLAGNPRPPRRLIDLCGDKKALAAIATEERPTNDHWTRRAEEECDQRHMFVAAGAPATLQFLDGARMSVAHKTIKRIDANAHEGAREV